MSDRCDSCGDEASDLLVVQRIYLELDEQHLPAGHRLADELETWCIVCRLTYPHQEVVGEG
jgi:hypothetical protein